MQNLRQEYYIQADALSNCFQLADAVNYLLYKPGKAEVGNANDDVIAMIDRYQDALCPALAYSEGYRGRYLAYH